VKIVNSLIAYFLYFISPRTLMQKSFVGTLLQFNIRLPEAASDEIVAYLYDIYCKNKKLDEVMKRGGITTNMERMSNLIQFEAFFIKDYLDPIFTFTSEHEFVLGVLEKYGYTDGYLLKNKQ